MTRTQQILDLVRKKGLVRAHDVEEIGLSRNYLYILCREGLLQKIARGLYALPNAMDTEHINLVEIAKRVPRAVVCLVSALHFHEITTQLPHEIWIAIPRGSWHPTVEYPPINLTYMSGEAYTFGTETHVIENVDVKVYSPAKTVADCFKFRNKIGLDVAIEALRETWRDRKATVDELLKAASICKVERVMRPYMEATV